MDKKHFFSRLLKKAVSMALWTKASLCGKSSLSEQSLPRTPSRQKQNQCNLRNPRLMNYLHAFGIFTTVERSLQISPFMQNKANFRKSQMNVTNLITKNYETLDTWWAGKNEPKTNPNEPNFKKAKMNVNKVLTMDYDNISNWAICENEPKTNPKRTQSNPIKANKMPKQTQYKPKQTQFQRFFRFRRYQNCAAISCVVF